MSLERFARSFQHPQCYGLSISLQKQNKRFYTVYLLQPALCGYIPKESRFTTLEGCTHSRLGQPSRQTFCIWFPIIYITGDRRVGLLSTGSEPVILTVVRIPKIAAVPRIGLGLHGSRPCELTTILYRYTAQLFHKTAARLNAGIILPFGCTILSRKKLLTSRTIRCTFRIPLRQLRLIVITYFVLHY